ncbi:hypothetical protein [Salinicola sp. CR57]|uniref:hypothetical protein n=1 Tax=Salinicola sp. CR57 TaxID=1949086 RepID=UPI001E3782B0|nr:hypothetical protein [Salinicola sp. CR57]
MPATPVVTVYIYSITGREEGEAVSRGKREEGRGKREEGRGKREEGRGSGAGESAPLDVKGSQKLSFTPPSR